MQGIGILQGDNDRFRPQDKILRSEAASILSVYLIYDQKPTLIVKTGFMSYKRDLLIHPRSFQSIGRGRTLYF